MCDIFALCSGHTYTAQRYLPIFAEKGKNNMNGWGIGFFRDGQAFVEKSAEKVFDGAHVHESFQRLARVVDSRVIVSQISCPLSGAHQGESDHPFFLSFLDHVWLFVHVGVVDRISSYETALAPRMEIEVFTARILEYLRDRMTSLMEENPYGSLYDALRASLRQLISEYPGHYTFFLTNGLMLFAFTNFRPLMLLRESETMGNILLITSIAEGLSPKGWLSIPPAEDTLGKLLVIAGADVLYLGNI
jgi:predicted glutamine amidotransferase